MAKRPSMFLGLVKERPSVSLCLGLGPKHVSVWARCRERDMFFVVTCCFGCHVNDDQVGGGN